jgi:hypothetical protein
MNEFSALLILVYLLFGIIDKISVLILREKKNYSGIIFSQLLKIYIEECSEIHHLSLPPCIYYTVYCHDQYHSIFLLRWVIDDE